MRLFSIAEVARLTGTSASFWRKAISRRTVPVVRLGRAVRIPEAAVETAVRLGVPRRPPGPDAAPRS